MRRRVTQKDVARELGIHHTTVSMVFRNHPDIPEETRKRVREAAERLGYLHDPMLSALAAYRTSRRPAAFHGTLAWLTNSNLGFNWRESPHFTVYYEASKQRALQHGYHLEEFDIGDAGPGTKRVASIMKARNIPGLFVCPQPTPYAAVDFPWEDFSAVTFGLTLAKPRLHTVVSAFYSGMRQALRVVRERGYKRIGLVQLLSDSQRQDHNVLASYLVDEHLAGMRRPPVPPLLENFRETPSALAGWFQRHSPEAIVSQDWRVFDVLRKIRVLPPRDVGLACAGIPPGVPGISGVVEDSRRIGEVAADLLAAMIQRGERGVPDKAQRILVDGDWQEGSTLRLPA